MSGSLIKIDNPNQRKLIDNWLEQNSPQAENIIINKGKAVRYDPRTKEAYQVDLTDNNIKISKSKNVDDFYSEIDGKKYSIPLYDEDFETVFRWDFDLFYNN